MESYFWKLSKWWCFLKMTENLVHGRKLSDFQAFLSYVFVFSFIITIKAWNFSRVRSHVFYTTEFHAFSCFSLCKNQQQKHGTFVVSGFMLFTQPSFMLFPCFSLCKKYETLQFTRKRQSMKLLSCPVWYILRNQVSCFFRVFRCVKSMQFYTHKVQQKHETFYTTKRLILVSCFWGLLPRWL
jgi:hypothetical protein